VKTLGHYWQLTRDNLTDSQWKRIEEMVPGKASDSVTAATTRRFVEAVLWIARTGAPWLDLPAEFGNWHSTYTRFSRRCKPGVSTRLMATLGQDHDLGERFFNRIKQFRRTATRYEKLARNFFGMISLACALIWLD